MNKEKKKKKQNRNYKKIAFISLGAILLILWVSSIYFIHKNMAIENAVTKDYHDFVLADAEPLIDKIGKSIPFLNYSATMNNEDYGNVFILEISNPYKRFYLLPLFPQDTLKLGVYVDQYLIIRKIWSLSPTNPLLFSINYSKFLKKWENINGYQLILNRETFIFNEGEELALPLRNTLKNLISTAFIKRHGEVEYERMIAEESTKVLKIGMAFPVFEVKTIQNKKIDSDTLKGKKTIIVTVSPTCGACYDSVMKIFKDIKDMKISDYNLVVFMYLEKTHDRAKLFLEQAPKDALIIEDPEKAIGKTLYIESSPYLVLLDKDLKVVFNGSGYSEQAILAALENFKNN